MLVEQAFVALVHFSVVTVTTPHVSLSAISFLESVAKPDSVVVRDKFSPFYLSRFAVSRRSLVRLCFRLGVRLVFLVIVGLVSFRRRFKLFG